MEYLLIGKSIGNYEIVDFIGKGGMGVVMKAVDRELDREVALKIMDSRLSSDSGFVHRFRTEARSQAKLRHPNIVNVYAMGESDVGLYIAMEYVDGPDISQRLNEEGTMPLDLTLSFIIQIAKAVEHAHSQGIIHRDIKPSNILIDPMDRVKVTDFGLAKHQDARMTVTGSSGGTIAYSSPEQLKSLKAADTRSDIYSMGMTLYEMICGRLPFEEESVITIQRRILQGKIPLPEEIKPDIPARLSDIITQAIHKDPNRRFATAQEMVRHLEVFETEYLQHKAKGKRLSTKEGSDLGRKLLKTPVLLGIFALVAVFLLGFYLLNRRLEPRTSPPPGGYLSIVTEPLNASLSIDDIQAGESPLNQIPVDNGAHLIRVSKTGYRSLDTTVWVSNDSLRLNLLLVAEAPESETTEKPAATAANQNNTKESPAAAIHGYLKVNSTPIDAEIWLNGRRLANAQTPSVLSDIDAGTYQLSIRKAGFLNYDTQINVEANSLLNIDAVLVAITGAAMISSEPAGAAILVDDQLIADRITPARLDDLTEGGHSISLQLDGFRKFDTLITIIKDSVADVRAKLGPASGRLSILAIPYGSIYINNDLVANDSHRQLNMDLPAGRHLIKVQHPSYGNWEREIIIDTDKMADLTVDFNRVVSVRVIAFDLAGGPIVGDIYIDDTFSGYSTPKKLSLRIGKHHIDVRKNGYSTTNGPLTLNLEEDRAEPLNFILKNNP